jgi:hypothetical protein
MIWLTSVKKKRENKQNLYSKIHGAFRLLIVQSRKAHNRMPSTNTAIDYATLISELSGILNVEKSSKQVVS